MVFTKDTERMWQNQVLISQR